MFCTKCGATLTGSKFCTSCGAPIQEETPAVEEIAIQEEIVEEVQTIEEAVVDTVLEAEVYEETQAEIQDELPPAADTCKNCGADLNGKAFCVMCGTSAAGEVPAPEQNADVCKNCGADLEGRAFCVMCGTSKTGAAPVQTPAPTPVKDVCKNCGADLNGKAFCVVCGTSKNGAAPVKRPVQTTVQPPVYRPVVPVQNPNEAITLKTIFGSTRFLITTILTTVAVLMRMLFGTVNIAGLRELFHFTASGASVSMSLPIMPILIAVGLWITYISAKGSGELKSVGMSICRVIIVIFNALIWIVFGITAFIGLAFLLIGLIMLVTGRDAIFNGFISTDYGSGGALSTAFIGFGILLAAGVMLLFLLLFFRRVQKFTQSAANSIKTGKAEFEYPVPVKNWLIFVAVVAIIFSILFVIIGCAAVIRSLGMIFLYTGLLGLVAAVNIIFACSWIKKYCVKK